MEFIDLKTQQSRIRESIDRRLAAVLDHGRYILGPEVSELEAALCQFVDCQQTIGVSSGTDSLLIALMALDIGPGDEVITVPYTWISTAEVIALTGATPVFIDIQPDTWNMDPSLLKAAITEKTKAIMPVGIYGQTSDMAAINRIAEEAGGIPVIEDAAQSFGATHHGARSGGLGTIGSTSFFPSKPLGGYGDGGAIFVNDEALAEKMRWIHLHGQSGKNHHPILGLNGRLDSMQAAVVLAKLEIFEEEIELRKQVGDYYSELLAGAGIVTPFVAEGNTSVYAQYTLLSDEREKMQERLKASEIPSVSYYAVPLHLQPVFSGLGYRKGDFPVTERIADQGLSLPMSPYVTRSDQEKIAEVILTCTS
ncbi:MAG: DegT/DnrJ/EryC1/StrS family aminotransferase [Verrucomicrobiales bacterium]|nr:DegT/DnrJ/EryC1/StrS family aminotransferase [Verrucomicrobiales bacterium]